MMIRPLALLLTAGLAFASSAMAQTGNATAEPAKTTVAQPPTPSLSPEDRGDILMARKHYSEAIEAYQEGPAKDPVLLNKVGIAYHQMTQLDRAKKKYEESIHLKPDYVEAINNLGTIYYTRKSYRRAIGYYDRALKLAPDNPRSSSIYANLGTALFARKKYPEATQAYENAVRLDPGVFEHRGNFGSMLEERTVEERAKYHYYIAKVYAKNGRNELALQYLRKAMEEGFHEKKKMAEDPDFAALRDLPEFQKLLTVEPRVL